MVKEYVMEEAKEVVKEKKVAIDIEAKLQPPNGQSNLMEEEINGSGGVKVEAWDEMGAGAREETSQGDLEVPAEGKLILE